MTAIYMIEYVDCVKACAPVRQKLTGMLTWIQVLKTDRQALNL